MQQHLLTIIILLPLAGALATVGYSLLPAKRESNYKWIALGFSVLDFALSLLLIRGIATRSFDRWLALGYAFWVVIFITSEKLAMTQAWSAGAAAILKL